MLKSNSVEVAEQRKEIATEENTTVTFENLPRYDSNGNAITYTATEEGNNKFYTIESTTGNMTDGYVITNKFQVPDEKVSVNVTKNWEDTEEQKDKRPEKVTIVLKANTEEVADQRKEISTTENTTVTFENLPKYDSNGDEIVYTATEEGNNKFYTVEETTGNIQEGYTVTNKFVKPEETTEITVTKSGKTIVSNQVEDQKAS